MDATADPRDNRLLAWLPQLLPGLEAVEMPLGLVLHEAGGRSEHAYFPTTAIVSLLHVLSDGDAVETAAVGFEGVVGVSLFMGGQTSLTSAVVRNAGLGLRLKAGLVLDEFYLAGHALNLFLRYTQALLTQTSQTAACNRHHSVAQQLCRWLLLCLDRMHSNELNMTHALIAKMLGVRREGITQAAGLLEKAGLISYLRGRITVLDRAGLERRSCECYAVVRNEYDRLLPQALAG
jgi:CRP-like cAMP-binding protein